MRSSWVMGIGKGPKKPERQLAMVSLYWQIPRGEPDLTVETMELEKSGGLHKKRVVSILDPQDRLGPDQRVLKDCTGGLFPSSDCIC